MSNIEVATFAGGCFWCTEALFLKLQGVCFVVSGYCGGYVENPTYEQVSIGTTGHAESIQIHFDPNIISYDVLLDVFFATHDPTTLNQQGSDVGSQYRSSIFYHSTAQKEKAEEKIIALKSQNVYCKPIVTEIVPFEHFYQAEEYHQNFYEKNQGANMYCIVVISPKIQKLRKRYEKFVRSE